MKSLSVTIKIQAVRGTYTVVSFCMLCRVSLTFESVDEILKCDH